MLSTCVSPCSLVTLATASPAVGDGPWPSVLSIWIPWWGLKKCLPSSSWPMGSAGCAGDSALLIAACPGQGWAHRLAHEYPGNFSPFHKVHLCWKVQCWLLEAHLVLLGHVQCCPSVCCIWDQRVQGWIQRSLVWAGRRVTGASPQEDVRLGTEIWMLSCEVGDELASCGIWDVKDKSLLKGQCDLLGSRALGGHLSHIAGGAGSQSCRPVCSVALSV